MERWTRNLVARHTAGIYLVMLLLAGPACPVAAEQGPPSDWPAFRGADGSGVSADTGLPLTWSATEGVLWKTDLPGAGSSTPIVIGQRIFVTCYSGFSVPGEPRGEQADLKLHLVCLDRATGGLLWTRDIAPILPEQDGIRDDHGYASNSPVADDQRVYAFFGKSGVLAFDHEGEQLWRAQVGSNLSGWGSGASLMRSGDHVIVNASVESERLYALEAATGQEAWRLEGIRESWNTPILVDHNGQTELVLAIAGKVLGVAPATGELLWNCDTDIPWYMVPSLVAHDGVVYALGGRPGGGLAVRTGGRGDVTATHRLWTSDRGTNVPSPLYHEGHLYWIHDNRGRAYCADAATGEVIYEEPIERVGGVYASPVLAEGRIYYPARSGVTHVVAARPEFELLASNSWGERGDYLASPAVAGGRLYFRTNRFICCVGTAPSAP